MTAEEAINKIADLHDKLEAEKPKCNCNLQKKLKELKELLNE